jgi:hypothetical protein
MSARPVYEKLCYYLGGIAIFLCILVAFGLFNHPLPFVDLIAYSYLNGISSRDISTGANFYVTQFSYILVHFIFRFLTIWGIGPVASSTAVFALQSFGIMVSFLVLIRACRIHWFVASLLSVFMISCYMGLGLAVWGGPLNFSFGVVLSLLSFCFFIEESPSRPKMIAGSFFAIACVLSHPFSLPILSILLFSVFIFSNREIKLYIAFTYALCISIAATSVIEFSQNIANSNSNASSISGLINDLMAGLITSDLSFLQLAKRIIGFLIFQSNTTEMLLGEKLISQIYFGYVTPLIVFAAFLISCIWLIALQKRKSIFNNTSKSLTVAVFLLFTYALIAPDSPFNVSIWPQRLLLAIFPLSFALVIIFFNHQNIKLFNSKFMLAAFAALLFLVPPAQIYQLSKLSKNFQSEVIQLEDVVLSTGITNSFFFFDNVDNIVPFWMRSVPFSLLVSESIKKNNLYYISEWHGHSQHNIRSSASTNKLPTSSMPIQRKCNGVNCEWIIPVPRFLSRSMQISIDEDTQSGTWYPLWVAGQEGAATLITVNFAKSGNSFRLDQLGYHEVLLIPGALCSGLKLQVDVVLDTFRKRVSIDCNGAVAEGNYPVVALALSQTDRLGVNNVTSSLGDVTPLAKIFPGEINENPIKKIEH